MHDGRIMSFFSALNNGLRIAAYDAQVAFAAGGGAISRFGVFAR
jgi:hypothetical protein